MARSLIPDPFELFREAVNRFEAGLNGLAQRKLAESKDVARTLHKVTRASVGVRQVVDRSLAGVLALLELPSRGEVAALAAAVQRVEDKLDLLLPASAKGGAQVPRPARTRRPAAAPTPPALPESTKPVEAAAVATRRAPRKEPAAKPARRSNAR